DRKKGLYGFIAMVGQLRFQKRWAQTPRIPQTSVLGHLLFVAILSYLISMEIKACEKRKYNNFFGGLFHDLPEVLTRDIISPVKKSVEGLDELIKIYEINALQEHIFPLIPPSWKKELEYFTQDEFANKICLKGDSVVTDISDQEMADSYNSNDWNPMDGKIIEACDKLAAFIEASQSIRLGIRSPALEEGMTNLYSRFGKSQLCGFPMGQLFDLFR
nr:HD domain-containing protein [Synergistales bacterium]